MILEAPGIIGTEEICEKITVAAIRAEFRHSLRLLVGYGLIDHAALDAFQRRAARARQRRQAAKPRMSEQDLLGIDWCHRLRRRPL